MNTTKISETFSVSRQLAAEDIRKAKQAGFGALINNRPDGESDDQPGNAVLAEEAKKAGLLYFYIPVAGGLTEETLESTRHALAATQEPVLAFCYSGTRSLMVWTVNEVLSGRMEKSDVIAFGRQHGYNLSGVLSLL